MQRNVKFRTSERTPPIICMAELDWMLLYVLGTFYLRHLLRRQHVAFPSTASFYPLLCSLFESRCLDGT